MMNPLELIEKYYPLDGKTYPILVNHGRLVANKCFSIAKNKPDLGIDLEFIEQAAMLHDIGICFTNSPKIGCYGSNIYICHGYLGSELLLKEGYPKLALVCERHTGTGISKEEIERRKLPLPHRDMIPISIEEQLICFADKFFSKSKPYKEKSIEEIRNSLAKFGHESVGRFDAWCKVFL